MAAPTYIPNNNVGVSHFLHTPTAVVIYRPFNALAILASVDECFMAVLVCISRVGWVFLAGWALPLVSVGEIYSLDVVCRPTAVALTCCETQALEPRASVLVTHGGSAAVAQASRAQPDGWGTQLSRSAGNVGCSHGAGNRTQSLLRWQVDPLT